MLTDILLLSFFLLFLYAKPARSEIKISGEQPFFFYFCGEIPIHTLVCHDDLASSHGFNRGVMCVN